MYGPCLSTGGKKVSSRIMACSKWSWAQVALPQIFLQMIYPSNERSMTAEESTDTGLVSRVTNALPNKDTLTFGVLGDEDTDD